VVSFELLLRLAQAVLLPLSLALSHEGRGDLLGEGVASFSSGRSDKPSGYSFPLMRAFPLPSKERAREKGVKKP
jgi:hypothetical protein